MKKRVVRWVAAVAVAAAVTFGCSSVFQQISEEASQGTGLTDSGDGKATSDFTPGNGTFSDAPVSPGGTGGQGPGADDNIDAAGEETRSFFTAFQIDPEAEDSSGPKFVEAADIDQDGLLDLVTGWNQSQPVQIHLQRRDAEGNISFRTITIGGTSPLAIIAGVKFGQIDDDNGDGFIGVNPNDCADPNQCETRDDCVDPDNCRMDFLDVVVLAKATGFLTLCPKTPPVVISAIEGEIIVLFSPGAPGLIPDGDAWQQMTLINPMIRCRRGTSGDLWIHNQFPGSEENEIVNIKTRPELDGFTALAVGNIDGVPGDEIVVALNTGECDELGQKPAITTVDLWINPGPGITHQPNQWGAPWFSSDPAVDISCPGPFPVPVVEGVPHPYSSYLRVPLTLMTDAPQFRDIELSDVDGDGDLDVIAAVSNAMSLNVRWVRNPLIPHNAGDAGGYNAVVAGWTDGWRVFSTGWDPRATGTRNSIDGTADARPIGQADNDADALALGDVDGDGFEDVVVRSSRGVVQWFHRPNDLVSVDEPEFPPSTPIPNRETVPDRSNFPWPVFTLTEFTGTAPEAIALGDVTGDGQIELIVAAGGAAFWYDGTAGESIFDPWQPNTIIQDGPPPDPAAAAATSAAPASTTTAGTGTVAPGTGVGIGQVDESTSINALLVVDLDGDGKNDIIGTLDRRTGPGVSDDRLVWYRNTFTEDTEASP